MIRQECLVDSDCPDYQRCVDGQCVEYGGNGGNGEPGGIPTALLVGGGIVLAILVIALGKKK